MKTYHVHLQDTESGAVENLSVTANDEQEVRDHIAKLVASGDVPECDNVEITEVV